MTVCRYCEEQEAQSLPGSVRALYCSTKCRARYRRSRRSSSDRKRAEHLAARLSAARTDAERAQAHWDALRAIIGRLPSADQPAAWHTVVEHLKTNIQHINERSA